MAKSDMNKKHELFEKATPETYKLIEESIEKQIEKSMIDYGTYIIEKRGIPNALDGFKMVQRRAVYTIKSLNAIGKKLKLARISGDCIGKYHPHGDSSVNETIANMLQPWKNNFPFFEGQGNWGSPAGDSPAAARYVEALLDKSSEELLFENINKDNVIPWVKNYSEDLDEPNLLPVKYPLHILNGTEGIAYSLATKIPSYNVQEITKLFIYLINNKFWEENFEVANHKKKIMEIIKGPDMPTHCDIFFPKNNSLEDTIFSPKFSFIMRAKYIFDEKNKKIIFSNIPTGTDTEKIKASILDLSLEEIVLKDKKTKKEKRIKKSPNEILNIKPNEPILVDIDEENPSNIKIEVSFKTNADLNTELVKLFKSSTTGLQKSFNTNFQVINHKGVPVLISFYENIRLFLKFRLHVVFQSFIQDIKKINKSLHLKDALKMVLLDKEVFLKILTTSENNEDFAKKIIKKFPNLDEEQIDYLLNIRIKSFLKQGLNAIINEIEELEKDKLEVLNQISSTENVFEYIKKDYERMLLENDKIKKAVRTSEILKEVEEIKVEDTISSEPIILFYNNKEEIGYFLQKSYRMRNRGNKNLNYQEQGTDIKICYIGDLTDSCWFITNKGRFFKTEVWKFSQNFQNVRKFFSKLEADEDIIKIVKVDEETLNKNVLLISNQMIKNIPLESFSNTSLNLVKSAIKFKEKEDRIIEVIIHDNNKEEEILLLLEEAKILRINKSEIAEMKSPSTLGTKVFTKPTKVIKAFLINEDNINSDLFIVSDNTKGKLININEEIPRNKIKQAPTKLLGSSKAEILNGILINKETTKEVLFIYENLELEIINSTDIKTVSKNTQGLSKISNLENTNILIYIDYALEV